MAYEWTTVPVAKSQESIRGLIYGHKGTGINIISRRPQEGFEALITLNDGPLHIRVMATCKPTKTDQLREQEERRVWRVLFYHLKAMFDATDSGVINILDVIMPYVVTSDGRTLSEQITPKIRELQTLNTEKLLTAG